jgi:hypothetical protein
MAKSTRRAEKANVALKFTFFGTELRGWVSVTTRSFSGVLHALGAKS